MFTAALDTCVLYPSTQRDFLLSLAIEDLYRPVWSSAVLEELEFHEARKLVKHQVPPADAAQRATRLIDRMRDIFVDSEISGWEPLEGTYGLPDPDDEHVVAAGVLAGAGVIVTENLKDFPAALLPPSLEAISAAEFAVNTVGVAPAQALRAVQTMSRRSGRQGPRQSVADVLDILEERYKMTDAVQLMRNADQ